MKYELGKVCSRLSSGNGIPASQVSDRGEYPVYGGNGLRGYTDHANFEGECVIIGRQGAFCGNVRFFSGKAYMTEHAVVVCTNEQTSTRYLAYLLSIMNLGRLSGQSAQPGLSVKTLAKQEIELPALEQQKKIVSILASLDDKIEQNQKLNDNLAALLQCVYQQQFGNTLESASTGQLAGICDYSRDKVAVSTLTPSTYYSTENMLTEKAGAVEASSLPTVAQTTKCAVGDVLISNIRPYFKKIVYCQSECGCSTDVLCFHPKMPDLSAYLFCTLYADCFFDFMVAGSKGTKMPRGDKQQIMTYMVNIPSSDELCKFNAVAVPVLSHMESNRVENLRLSALRNTLLPRLMSGELDVSALDL